MRNKALNIIVRAEMGIFNNGFTDNRGIIYAAGFHPFDSSHREKWDKLYAASDTLRLIEKSHKQDSYMYGIMYSLYKDFMIDLISSFFGPTVELLWRRRKDLDLVKEIQQIRMLP